MQRDVSTIFLVKTKLSYYADIIYRFLFTKQYNISRVQMGVILINHFEFQNDVYTVQPCAKKKM